MAIRIQRAVSTLCGICMHIDPAVLTTVICVLTGV